MKLSCLQENLNRGLGIVGRAVATRTTLPITQNVLLASDKGRLKLSATNLEIAITTWIGANMETEGAITVPARLLTDLVGSLPSDRMELTVAQRPLSLQVKCARFEARLNGTDAGDFPPLPTVEEGVIARIGADTLRSAINQVVFAAATEESRPVLTGVKVEIEGTSMVLAAADGFRLAVRRADIEEAVSEQVGVIIPARTLQEVNRLLAEQDEPVEFTITPAKSQVMFRLKNAEVISQLVQGTFPNYAQLMPQSYQTRTVVDLRAFHQAVRTASIFARDGSGIVRCQMAPGPEGGVGKLTISSRAEELGENLGEIDAKIEGEEAKIAFNNRYLMDVLGALEGGEVAMETTSPSSPGVFKPVGTEDDYTHVVMPMFVQW